MFAVKAENAPSCLLIRPLAGPGVHLHGPWTQSRCPVARVVSTSGLGQCYAWTLSFGLPAVFQISKLKVGERMLKSTRKVANIMVGKSAGLFNNLVGKATTA